MLAVTLAGWLGLVVHPQPLFAYTTSESNIVLHARRPFPAATQPLLAEVVRRVAASPLYDRARVHHVFLCDTPALFGLLALWDWKVGGVTQTMLAGNVLIRPYDLDRDVVFGRMGVAKQGRTLTYFIAHEVTHAMTADRLGRWGYRRLAAFQQEGYADHVGYARPLNLRVEREALVHDAPEMDARRSGLYRRYELLVTYLLDHRGLRVDQLLAGHMDPRAIEADLLADPSI